MTNKILRNDPNLMSAVLKLKKELYIQRQKQEAEEERARLMDKEALLKRNKPHWKLIG